MEEAVFARIAALEQRRERLEKLSSTPAELELLSKADLEEMRRLLRPPQAVRQCLEVVYVVLNLESVKDQILRLPTGGLLSIRWESVLAMLAKFETFFPSMDNYDIGDLMAVPEVACYLQRAYFGEDGLTQERVYRCNVACAALFRWCSRSLARVEAALELLLVKQKLLELRRPGVECWQVETEEGWVPYPADVNRKLEEAEATGEAVDFTHAWTNYEINLVTRTQRNVFTGFLRPVRPPGIDVDLRALQGSWHTSWGSDVSVCGTQVVVDGQTVGPELEPLAEGGVRWVFLGEWRTCGGSPLCVEWEKGDSIVTWVPIAASVAARASVAASERMDTAVEESCAAPPAPVLFDATNCSAAVTVSSDGLSAGWGDDWGAVAVRTGHGNIPSLIRLECTSLHTRGDVAVGIADARVADFDCHARPHSEEGGWLLRGCLEEDQQGRLRRVAFNLWHEGQCTFCGPVEPLDPGSEVYVQWDDQVGNLIWLEDCGTGLKEQARLQHIKPQGVPLLYCWGHRGASAKLV